jgi:hypothetical protein
MGIMVESVSGPQPWPPHALTSATLQYWRQTSVPLIRQPYPGRQSLDVAHGLSVLPVPALAQ